MTLGHLTTRRGFVATFGFAAVGLYGAWAAYGAAPLPFGGRAETAAPGAAAGGHAGHGGAGGLSPEDFTKAHEAFLSRFTLPDGSVEPGPGPDRMAHAPSGHAPVGHADGPEHHAGAPPVAPGEGGHGAHAGPGHGSVGAEADGGPAAGPIDVYLLAYRFGFDPPHLRLRAGTPYRFRMMAQDLAHGASLQVGPASRIVRLRPGTVSEQTVTFGAAGEVLVYCTVFCGAGHDVMAGRITVA